MRSFPIFLAAAVLILVTGCASSTVDESARLVGREGDVRIDALMTGLRAGGGSTVNISYEVENLRPEPIAIADIIPEVMYDPDTGLITVLLGSEVPGNQFLPRLMLIRSGEKMSFSTGANLSVPSTARTAPRAVHLRLSYLENVEPFESLVGITQKAVHDPELAEEMFLPWADSVRFVNTNDIPLQWRGQGQDRDISSTNRRAPRPPGTSF